MLATEVPRRILVVGATGKQGGATLNVLLKHPSPYEVEILALTRNEQTKSAQTLAQKPKVTVVTGDLNNIDAVFEKVGGVGSIWGVFSAQALELTNNPAEGEEVKQGRALIDASIKYGVQHFVQSGVDRGGEESDKNPTPVNHFISKHIIETYLMEKAQNNNMTYTILRPVAFMDMLTPDFNGRLFGSMWRTLGDIPLQLIATKDIGIFAAQAFSAHYTDEYKNTAISLAGDALTYTQANEVFWKVLHRPMPTASIIVPPIFKVLVPEMGTMFKWFAETQYGADLEKCQKLNSALLNLANFLREESLFNK